MLEHRVGVALVVLFVLLQGVAFGQTPLWRDGSLDATRQQLDDWRETVRRNELRERARIDRVHDLQSTERLWHWTDRTAPVDLFAVLPTAPSPSRPR